MEEYKAPFEGKPDARDEEDRQKIANKGEIVFEERLAMTPTRSADTMRMTHRGGIVSHRTEHY